jgi:hypothetical protein
VYRVFSGIGCRGNGVGRWYVLNTLMLGYVLCGGMAALCAYMYIYYWGGASNFQYVLILMDSCRIVLVVHVFNTHRLFYCSILKCIL